MSASFGRGAAVKAAFLITGSTYITYGLSLLVGAVVARDLGPELYGQYAYLVWLSGWLVIVVNNGLNTSGIRFVSQTLGSGSPDIAHNVHGWLLRKHRASLAAVVLGFIMVLWWIKPQEWQGHLLLFVCVAIVSLAARATYLFDISIAKGHGAFHVEAYSTLVVTLLNALGIVVLAVTHASLTAYLLLFTAASIGLWAYAELMLRRADIRPTHQPLDPALTQQLRQHLLWTILLVTSGSVGSKSVETFLLNSFVGAKEVGFFTISVGLTRGGVDLLTIGLSTVLMPAMGRAFGEGGNQRVHVIFRESLRLFLFFGLLLAGVGALWSSAAVMLLYGDEYTQVIPVLQVMIIVGGITLSEAACGSLLSTTGRQSSWAKISFLSLILSVLFAFSFIPRFGLTGAVASFACTRLIVFTVLVTTVVRSEKIALPLRALVRLLLSGTLAVAFALPLLWMLPGASGNIVAGAVYVLALLSASVLLRAWDRSHLEFVLSASSRLPAGFSWVRPVLVHWRDRYTG